MMPYLHSPSITCWLGCQQSSQGYGEMEGGRKGMGGSHQDREIVTTDRTRRGSDKSFTLSRVRKI
jgi:hypothetical protein